MECLSQQLPLIADAMLKRNQKTATIHGRIINHSEYKEVLFELAGDKKNERALKTVNGNANNAPSLHCFTVHTGILALTYTGISMDVCTSIRFSF